MQGEKPQFSLHLNISFFQTYLGTHYSQKRTNIEYARAMLTSIKALIAVLSIGKPIALVF
jgi:hypothetical protein